MQLRVGRENSCTMSDLLPLVRRCGFSAHACAFQQPSRSPLSGVLGRTRHNKIMNRLREAALRARLFRPPAGKRGTTGQGARRSCDAAARMLRSDTHHPVRRVRAPAALPAGSITMDTLRPPPQAWQSATRSDHAASTHAGSRCWHAARGRHGRNPRPNTGSRSAPAAAPRWRSQGFPGCCEASIRGRADVQNGLGVNSVAQPCGKMRSLCAAACTNKSPFAAELSQASLRIWRLE